ncbi:MAG: HAD hydrolase-like protein [Bacteroidetes bacterium]|nr:HAD hydrolase-like protein [Bacteroidota bacterium]MDA1334183.1 HAD hydrolase-like protein [Bacteroidota bacterium]
MILLLFDIDGTLLISNGVGRRSITRALSDVVGREVTSENVSFSGRTDPAIVRDMLSGSGFTGHEIDQLMPRCLERYQETLMDTISEEHITLMPGVPDIVDRLLAIDDVQLALVTGNLQPTAYAKLTAAKLAEHFPFGAFGSDHEIRNELPGMAMQRAHDQGMTWVEPDRTVIIGDTEHDIGCARHAGVRAVAVATGMVTHDKLNACNPDLLLQDMSDPEPLTTYIASLR